METSPVPSPSNCNWVPIDEIKTSSPIAGPRQTRREGGPNVLFGSMDSKNKGEAFPEAEFFAAREDENKRKLQGGVRLTETDRVLKEESMRYEKGLSFDHSGDLDEEGQADKSLWLTVYKACNERIKECKEVGGIHCNSDKGREMEGQETKVQCMTDSIARSIGAGRFLGWRAVNAEGASGGIFICWDRRALDMLDWEEERNALWEEFGAIRGLWEDPWCIGGDFNITLFSRERSGQRRISSAMRNFAEIVDDLGLLDRSIQWDQPVQAAPTGVRSFPNYASGGWDKTRPDPFRFENMWLKAEGFKELVRSWWQGIDVRGSASYKLATKMKEIKQKLKVWNREVFGKLESNKSAALQQVEFWDREENDRILTMEEVELKKEAKENYKKWVIMEETHWRQLSREIWLKEGDRNTGFFHRMASAHRRNNCMERVKINGEWFLEEQEIREGIANAFKELLSEDMGGRRILGVFS
ncbi:hypothetical protein CK203_046685 [Vitis vinifera]|uniref:Uncharacterized protein n=1 Tax=Vitis vinifera TaxID=29760 RepID=A0A438HJY3_VITVI|nr:hypothetical protein CK203_046685 [Vitis vinifera]